MSALASGYVTLEKLEQIVAVLKKKGDRGFKFTVSIDDKSKEYKPQGGNTIYQNVSYYAEQTEEERKAKKDKFYFANGGVFWTNDKIVKAGPNQEQQATAQSQSSTSNSDKYADDLPF